MKRPRKKPGGALKAKVALAAVKGARRRNALAGHFAIHPPPIVQRKQRLVTGASDLFPGGGTRAVAPEAELRDRPYQEIGQLKVALAGLEKKSALPACAAPRMGPAPPSPVVRAAPMRAAGPGAGQLLLPRHPGVGREPVPPTPAGRGIYPASLLWGAQNDGLAALAAAGGGAQARALPAACPGPAGRVSPAALKPQPLGPNSEVGWRFADAGSPGLQM